MVFGRTLYRINLWTGYLKIVKRWSRAPSQCACRRFSSTDRAVNAKKVQKKLDLSEFTTEYIRNFSIIAHVDHGKSTLADRLLELTGTITGDHQDQMLDRLQVERERGITVKAQTVSLIHKYKGQTYLLNLVDTPGHVDFNYEVSRSLAACEGVILLIDASQGVQAQTVANFYLAFESELTIIPVLNKIDLKHADPEEVIEQIESLFDIPGDEVLQISAKTGIGVEEVLPAVIERIPPPSSKRENPLKLLLFDSWYDQFRGPVALAAVKDGSVSKGDRLQAAHTEKLFDAHEVGIMHPDPTSVPALHAGQVGYIYTSLKNVEEAQVGDTWFTQNQPVEALPGFKPAKCMVYAGVYPVEAKDYDVLKTAINKLTLNDASVDVNLDRSNALGRGWRLGFLGLLHMEVFSQRLEQEHGASIIMTSPNVPYKVELISARPRDRYPDEEMLVLNPAQMPESQYITSYLEPLVKGTVITPLETLGVVQSLLMERRGQDIESVCIDSRRVMFHAVLPLSEVIIDFFDELKRVTSGYASFDYEEHGYEHTDLVQVKIYLNDREVDELSMVAHLSKARGLAKKLVAKLKEEIPRQLYEVRIQAKVGSKSVSTEKISPLKKDVLAKCYGGDITRKMKLLKRQAEGKKKLKRLGNVDVPKESFWNILKR